MHPNTGKPMQMLLVEFCRQSNFICTEQLRQKATQSVLQQHQNYIEIHKKLHLKYINDR